MMMNKKSLLLALGILLVLMPADAKKKKKAGVVESHPALAAYFSDPAATALAPDEQGFIRRWTLLEPVSKPNRSNILFTDSYIREAFATFPGPALPAEGDAVKVDGKKLYWHSLDSQLFNVKLFRYAAGLEKERYGVIFWAVTELDFQEEVQDVRLLAGSNSASMWWLDGEEVLILSGDRRMVMDDGASSRLKISQGRHVLRCAVINGPGMSDFCVRFVDKDGQPVRCFTVLNR